MRLAATSLLLLLLWAVVANASMKKLESQLSAACKEEMDRSLAAGSSMTAACRKEVQAALVNSVPAASAPRRASSSGEDEDSDGESNGDAADAGAAGAADGEGGGIKDKDDAPPVEDVKSMDSTVMAVWLFVGGGLLAFVAAGVYVQQELQRSGLASRKPKQLSKQKRAKQAQKMRGSY